MHRFRKPTWWLTVVVMLAGARVSEAQPTPEQYDLVANPAIQFEIKLSAEQRQGVRQIIRDVQKEKARLRKLTGQERTLGRRALRDTMQKRIGAVLQPRQRQRLAEIQIQFVGRTGLDQALTHRRAVHLSTMHSRSGDRSNWDGRVSHYELSQIWITLKNPVEIRPTMKVIKTLFAKYDD